MPRERETESVRWRDSLALVQQVGRTGPDTRLISVCDREGDIWEMFALQARDPQVAGLLVRSGGATRGSVIVDCAVQDLKDYLAAQPSLGVRSVTIAARGGVTASCGRKAIKARPARTAQITVQAAQVALKAPGKSRQTLPLTAVLATETKTNRRERISWPLISSDGEATFEAAETIIDHYASRWTIEEYFKTLKQHTRIEDRRLDEAEDLCRCLAFDAIVTCRVFDVQKSRQSRPALDFFHIDEFTALYIGMKGYGFRDIRVPPFGDLTIRETAIDVARYAGFIPAKRQPLPGTEKNETRNDILAPSNRLLQSHEKDVPHIGVNSGIVTAPERRRAGAISGP